MNLNLAEKNALDATKALLDIAQVRATTQGLREAFWQHPDFPNLNALSEILTDWGVPNLATRISPDQLFDIPLPALAYLQVDGGVFAPVRQVGTTIEWLHTQRGWQKDSFNEFVQKWNGVMLLIEPQPTSGERDYTQNRQKEQLENLRVPFIIGALGICMGVLVYQLMQQHNLATNWHYYALLLTKTIGTTLGAMLVWYSIDSQNTFLQSVCKINNSTNCNNILNYPAAKLTNWLSWSEVGLFYFGGGLIYLISPLTPRGGTNYLLSLWGLGVLALPYTFWSIWYQWRIVRQWCVLCLAVQALIWVEFCLMQTSPQIHEGGFNAILQAPFGRYAARGLGAAFLILPALWALLKPYLQRAVHYRPLLREFQKLKFNPAYLQALLSQQRQLPPVFEGMKVIEMGNSEAEHTLVVISNPTCASCRRNHLALEKLLQKNNDLKCQIIMAANPQDEAGKVALQILSLPTDQMANALHSWFEKEGQQHRYWQHTLPNNSDTPEAKQQLNIHLHWLHLADIQTAPQYFLNSVPLPSYYNMAELPKLMAAFSNEGFAQIK